MEKLTWLLSGGFLKGYRTYILVAVSAVTVLANFAVGDIGLQDMVSQLSTVLAVGTVRAAITPSS